MERIDSDEIEITNLLPAADVVINSNEKSILNFNLSLKGKRHEILNSNQKFRFDEIEINNLLLAANVAIN